MLYFKRGTFEYHTPTSEWHLGGKTIPYLSRVMSFQADGDELRVILEALAKYGDEQQKEKAEKRNKQNGTNSQDAGRQV